MGVLLPYLFILLCVLATVGWTRGWRDHAASARTLRAARVVLCAGMCVTGFMMFHLVFVTGTFAWLLARGEPWPVFRLYSLLLVGLVVLVPGERLARSARGVARAELPAQRAARRASLAILVLALPLAFEYEAARVLVVAALVCIAALRGWGRIGNRPVGTRVGRGRSARTGMVAARPWGA